MRRKVPSCAGFLKVANDIAECLQVPDRVFRLCLHDRVAAVTSLSKKINARLRVAVVNGQLCVRKHMKHISRLDSPNSVSFGPFSPAFVNCVLAM